MITSATLIGVGCGGLTLLTALHRRPATLLQRLNPSTVAPNAASLQRGAVNLETVESELAALLGVLPLLLRGGFSPVKSLEWCAARAGGDLGTALSRALSAIELGESEARAFAELGDSLGCPSVREFSIKVRTSLHRGNRLAEMLESQSIGVHGIRRATRLSSAARAEGRMMLPLVFVILPVTIGVALLPSIAAFSQLS